MRLTGRVQLTALVGIRDGRETGAAEDGFKVGGFETVGRALLVGAWDGVRVGTRLGREVGRRVGVLVGPEVT